jgi:hypothetical protein
MKRHLKWICALLLVVILGDFGFAFVVREGSCAIVCPPSAGYARSAWRPG